MSMTDSIMEFFVKVFGKRVVWWGFNMLDWVAKINTQESLVEYLVGMRDTYELDIELFTSEGEEKDRLLENKIQESKNTLESVDFVNKEAGDSVEAAVISGFEFEVYTREMFEEEKKTYNIEQNKETLIALDQVIDEAKQGKFKHSLSKSMQRLEELTNFEIFSLDDDDSDKNT